jgi:predicted O-methyltransferase YrrM
MSDSSSRAGARYATAEIQDYVQRVHVAADAGLTRAFTVPDGMPAIMVQPSEGRLIHLVARLCGAKKIVEVGTLAGYSAIHLAFIDADKDSYDFYAEWAVGNLRRGGVVLGDNAYLFGELVGDTPRAQAMRRFHERVAAACDSTCIPTPDGLVLGIVR